MIIKIGIAGFGKIGKIRAKERQNYGKRTANERQKNDKSQPAEESMRKQER